MILQIGAAEDADHQRGDRDQPGDDNAVTTHADQRATVRRSRADSVTRLRDQQILQAQRDGEVQQQRGIAQALHVEARPGQLHRKRVDTEVRADREQPQHQGERAAAPPPRPIRVLPDPHRIGPRSPQHCSKQETHHQHADTENTDRSRSSRRTARAEGSRPGPGWPSTGRRHQSCTRRGVNCRNNNNPTTITAITAFVSNPVFEKSMTTPPVPGKRADLVRSSRFALAGAPHIGRRVEAGWRSDWIPDVQPSADGPEDCARPEGRLA